MLVEVECHLVVVSACKPTSSLHNLPFFWNTPLNFLAHYTTIGTRSQGAVLESMVAHLVSQGKGLTSTVGHDTVATVIPTVWLGGSCRGITR